jgi:hypothetical protein
MGEARISAEIVRVGKKELVSQVVRQAVNWGTH